jgi:hypothetical protein
MFHGNKEIIAKVTRIQQDRRADQGWLGPLIVHGSSGIRRTSGGLEAEKMQGGGG